MSAAVLAGVKIVDVADHGYGAIYGQAQGSTEMTEWKIVKKGEGGEPTLVAPEKSYAMQPGDAYLYDIGDVHSPKREQPTWLLRIEGKNLDKDSLGEGEEAYEGTH